MFDDHSKRDTILRLKKIQGQVHGLEKMVDEKRYCIDILNQISAVRRALDGVAMVLMKRHVETCVTNAARANKGADSIAELMDSVGRFVR